MIIEVLAPVGLTFEEHPAATVVRWHSSGELVGLIRARPPEARLVVVTDGLDEPELALVAGAITSSSVRAVEVRSERWDGQTQSPVSGACTGVISGFGAAGISAAVELSLDSPGNA